MVSWGCSCCKSDATEEDFANAALIVHCVNAHDALVEALQQILKHAPQAEPESETYDDTESAYSNGYDNACWELALIARKALALTEKGTS